MLNANLWEQCAMRTEDEPHGQQDSLWSPPASWLFVLPRNEVFHCGIVFLKLHTFLPPTFLLKKKRVTIPPMAVQLVWLICFSICLFACRISGQTSWSLLGGRKLEKDRQPALLMIASRFTFHSWSGIASFMLKPSPVCLVLGVI